MKVATLVIALWGALLSSALALRAVLLERPRPVMRAWTEVRKCGNSPISHLYSIVLTVDNRSRRDLCINAVGWGRDPKSLRWHEHLVNQVTLPHLVLPGQRASLLLWALPDTWPIEDIDELHVGIESGGKRWTTAIDPETRVTG